MEKHQIGEVFDVGLFKAFSVEARLRFLAVEWACNCMQAIRERQGKARVG